MTLWLLHQTGCHFCAEAKAELAKFKAMHLGEDVEVKSIDLTVEEWPESAPILAPESVPAYVLIDEGVPPRTMESRGVLSAEDLARWVFGWA